MAPHSLTESNYDGTVVEDPSYYSPSMLVRETEAANAGSTGTLSNLQSVLPDEVQDLVCVGFGPANLAIAVALHDSLGNGKLSDMRGSAKPKVLFLEKQHRFAWHAGMLLPGAKMQISFMKDMATFRDPTSKFTFLNYLHQNGRLVDFTNLNTFLPARAEYEDYLRWCAAHFDDVVRYGNEVTSVSPSVTAEPVSIFLVTSKNVHSGVTTTHRTRNVMIAVGGQPSIPRSLPSSHPRVIHSSQYSHLVPQILYRPDAPYRVAIIGAGQSAAEIFNNIQTLYPNSRTTLIMRNEFLRPSDDSPFINSIFNPSYVDSMYSRSENSRRNLLMHARSTNYSVVRLELIEHLYERMYDQRRKLGTDERQWPHRILGATEVVTVNTQGKQLSLTLRPLDMTIKNNERHDFGISTINEEQLDVDLIIAATGYQRQSHITMMKEMGSLLPRDDEGDGAPRQNEVKNKGSGANIDGRPVRVLRDYSVQFARGKVSVGSGVWLQGCCEETHGLSDSLLSVLATRSGDIIDAIFSKQALK